MNPLELQKQLLIAESELNRAQLVQNWQTMANEVRTLAHQAKTISSIASATATLIAVLSSFRRKNAAPASEKSSGWQAILKGTGLISSLWSEFRPQGRDRAAS